MIGVLLVCEVCDEAACGFGHAKDPVLLEDRPQASLQASEHTGTDIRRQSARPCGCDVGKDRLHIVEDEGVVIELDAG